MNRLKCLEIKEDQAGKRPLVWYIPGNRFSRVIKAECRLRSQCAKQK